MTVKLEPYKDLILRAKEKVDEAMAPIRAMQMRKKGEIEILKLDEEILSAENKISELAGKHPIDYDAVLSAIDKMEIARRRRRKFQELLKALFPESAEAKVDRPE